MRTAVNPKTGERIFFDEASNSWQPMQSGAAQEEPQGVTGSDIVRGGLSGATLGFGDELRGAAFEAMNVLGDTGSSPGKPYVHQFLAGAVPSYPDSYKAYRDSEREKLEQFREQHPGAALASEFTGGLATGILGGAKAGGTALARNLASRGLGTRMAASSLAGGGAGAVAGAGEAPELEDVPGMAARGAAIGAVAGPLVEGTATGVQSLARRMTPQRAAERAVKKAIERGDDTLPRAQAKLRKMGPNATLADVNEGVLTELDRLVNTPGKTRTKALKQLAQRSSKQIDEILATSGKGQYFENLEAAKEIQQRVASPIYQRAYEQGVDHTQELDDIFRGMQEALPGAWSEAKKFGKLDLVGQGIEIPDLGDAVPTLRGWQAVKEHLDDQIGKFSRAGESGKAGKLLRLKRRLLNELDSQNPDYGVARGIWAGTKEFESAMEDGLSFMRPGLSAAKLRMDLKPMNDTQRLAYKEGARQAIQDTMERAGYTHDASKFFRSPAMTAKINAVFGFRDGAKLLRTISSSAAKQRTYSRVSGNSLTALRQAAQAEEGVAQDVLSSIAEMASSSPSAASGGLLRQAAKRIPTSRESTRNIIGDMLLETDPVKQRQLFEWLSQGKPQPPPTGAGLLAPLAIGAGGGILSTR